MASSAEDVSDPGSPTTYHPAPRKPNIELRDFLHQDWARDTQAADQFAKLDGYSVTDLVLEYLDTRAPRKQLLDRKQRLQDSNPSAPSLRSLAIRTIIRILKTARQNETLEDEFRLLLSDLPENALHRLFEDPQMPYVILRRFLVRLRKFPAVCEEGATAGLVDIDEMVLRHERYLRSLPPSSLDQQMLVTFGDITTYYDCPCPNKNTDADFVSFTRQDPPKGGLELLDYRRPHRLRINVNDKIFAANFDQFTSEALQGLDWANILVSGDLVLRVLLKAHLKVDNNARWDGKTILIHLWGLKNAAEALQKIESLYDVWSTNMSSLNLPVRCLKRRDSIHFISGLSGLSVKINLKLYKNPLDVLLQQRLDICNVGFNGSQVLMLPSCARALETGYNTFSSRYLYDDPMVGYYRNNDSLFGYCHTPESALDIFKLHHYAGLGFGLQILPSYAKTLHDEIEVPRLIGDDGLHKSRFRRAANRGETGIKILKRFEFLGRLWTKTTRTTKPGRPLSLRRHCEDMRNVEYGSWESGYEEASAILNADGSYLISDSDGESDSDNAIYGVMQLSDCLTRLMGQPRFRPTNLHCFETFLRQCELSSSLHPGRDSEDLNEREFQDYNDSTFSDAGNGEDDRTFTRLQGFICARVNIPYRPDGWRDYVKRRIRSKYGGNDLATILEKQMVVPVIIPYDLEQHISQVVDDVREDSGVEIPEFLIPIHEQGKGSGLIPDYTETTDSKIGNIKYWVLSNEMMWRGIHPRIDEIFHVLDILYQVFLLYEDNHMGPGQGSRQHPEARIDTEFFKNSLGANLRRRLPADLEDCHSDGTKADTNSVMATGASKPLYQHCAITAKEALKFRQWVFGGPDIPVHYEGSVPTYPFPDELFWKDEEEGVWNGDEIPQWTDKAPWDVEN